MAGKFKYEIPRAKYKKTGFRASDGRLVETLTKIRSCPRNTSLGQRQRRHIKTIIVGGMEYVYHATKSWRTGKA